jgi:hypothetical protein
MLLSACPPCQHDAIRFHTRDSLSSRFRLRLRLCLMRNSGLHTSFRLLAGHLRPADAYTAGIALVTLYASHANAGCLHFSSTRQEDEGAAGGEGRECSAMGGGE